MAAMVVFVTSSGWPSVVTSNMFSPAPSRRLLNFMGFFSSFLMGGAARTAESAMSTVESRKGPDQGTRSAWSPEKGK